MKRWQWLGGCAVVAVWASAVSLAAELSLPRPGAVTVASLMGEATLTAGGERKAIKAEDRLRIGATLATGRKSSLTLTFSNGIEVQLGPESEMELEEFGQAPVGLTVKFQELKEEPTLSRTRLRLTRGEVTVAVRPLKVARGSSFVLETPAGAVRTGAGRVRATTRMSELGLGVGAVELLEGAAEFERAGAAVARLEVGRRVTLALEKDRRSGEVRVGPMPEARK